MVAEDGENTQQAEKVGLKRKLTGPPRLLLGKTRSRSVTEDRPETKTDQMDEDEPSVKSAADAADGGTAELTEIPNMEEEVSSEVNVESCRGRCEDTGEDTGEDSDLRNRKVNRRRWWRRFTSAVVCIRRQKKNVVNITEENNESVSEEKRTFVLRMMFKRSTTSSETQQQRRDLVEKDGDEPSLTFQKKLRRFFTKGGTSSSSSVPLENAEDVMKLEEAPCSSDAQVEEQTEPQSEGTDLSSQAVTVTAETNVQLLGDRAAAESPEESTERLRGDIDTMQEDVTDAADGSGTIQTADDAPVGELVEVVSSDKDEIFSSEVLDDDDHVSASTVSSELHQDKKTDQTTSQLLQPSTNRPSIRIELVPPDDVGLQDEEEEEEECWEGGSSENQNHLLLLLGFDHSEQQLLHTARSLVRAAMNAAVDQLSREQQSGSDCVHREPQGCRDHA